MESLQIFFFAESSRGFSSQLSECDVPFTVVASSSPALRNVPQRQKKKRGAGKTKGACEKRACVGAPKRPPSLTKRPWTQRVRGSLAPLATKDAVKIPKKGAANMPPPKNGPSPGPHSGEGLVRPPPG